MGEFQTEMTKAAIRAAEAAKREDCNNQKQLNYPSTKKQKQETLMLFGKNAFRKKLYTLARF